MGLVIGILLFALGVVTFWGWMPATLVFLKGLVSFSLLFWGFVAMLVGYSERKAKREFKTALRDKVSPAEMPEVASKAEKAAPDGAVSP